MTIFTKTNRKKLITGLIGILLTALGLWVRNYFSAKEKNPVTQVAENPVLNSTNSDSAKQTVTLNQVTQTNSNKGDVNNEFISGDKNIYTYNQTINETEKKLLNNKDLEYFKKRIPSKSCNVWLISFNLDIKSQEYATKIKNSLLLAGYQNVHVPQMILRDLKPKMRNKIDIEVTKDSLNVNIQIYPTQS